MVSNPLDEMTFLAAQTSGFPKERVFGMAGVLDSARLRYFISEVTGASPSTVEAMTLGSHGDAMIALPRQATVGGRPAARPGRRGHAGAALPAHSRRWCRDRRSAEGGVGLLRTERIRRRDGAGDRGGHRTPCSRCARGRRGQYGIDDVYVGVPARLGRSGIEEIVELDLNEEELTALRGAADGIRAKCEDLAKL